MQNTEETIAKYIVDANLFRLWSTNPKKKITRPWMFFGGRRSPPPKKTFFFKNVYTFKKKIINAQIHMIDAECAETNEKSSFRFLFFEL